jgi:alkylation response protein AidB-like acyl-CoA dehydrogenase
MPTLDAYRPETDVTPPLRPARAPKPRVYPPSPSPAELHEFSRQFSIELKKTVVERERAKQLPVAETRALRESGLVNLLIPREFGGAGGTQKDAARIVTEISKGDANVGALLGYHYINSAIPRLFDFKGGAEAVERQSAAQRWLWGNVSQPQEKNFRADPLPDGGFLVNGVKGWCTGPSLADVTTVLAPRSDREEFLFAYIPTDREGLTYHDDWDHLGLRLTDTVTISFKDVVIKPEEVIRSTHGEPQVGFPPYYGGAIFASYYIGSAWGALDSAREYTLGVSRPRGGVPAYEDPYVLQRYGEFFIQLRALDSLRDTVTDELDEGWRRRHELSLEQLAEIQTRASVLRPLAAKIALDIGARIFEVAGARATASEYGFDRFWRDVRAHSLHDSIDGTVRALGEYVLKGTVRAKQSFYARRASQEPGLPS